MYYKQIWGLAFLLALPGTSYADNSNSGLRYGLSYIGDYSSCSASCQETTLNYADDQIDQLDAALNDAGLTKLFKYAGNQTQSTDITEDYYHGYDNIYGDAVELYAVTTHGGIATNINNKRVFMATYCTSGNANYSSDLSWDTGKL